jgi:hypothetical protein
VGKTAAIEMSSGAETLPARSGSTWIEVQLTDSTGNPVDQDTRVVFRTNIGTFSSNRDQKETSRETADESGVIRVTLHAPYDPGVAEVEAESNGVRQTVEIRFLDPDEILNIDLTLGSSSIVADGATQVTARAVVTNANGSAVSGKRVNFSSTAGTLITASDITDASGTAEVRLRSSTISGPVTVRAECDGFTDEASMEFVPGPVDKILLYAFPNVVPPDGAFQTAAIVMDENENRISTERMRIELRRVGSSRIIDQAELTADQAEDGVYKYDWTAESDYYGSGNIAITAIVNNYTSETVIVEIREGAVIVGSVDVTAGSTSLEADGSSQTAIHATVLDNEGQPAPGITVNFSTTLGTLLPSSATTNENGIAEIRLRAGYTEGTAKVRAEANGWIDEVEVDFEAGFPGRLNVSVIPDVVEPGETATVIATLTDSGEDPISAEELYFSLSTNVSGGSVSPGTVTTDGSGQARATYTAGFIEGRDRIRVVSASNSNVEEITTVQVQAGSGLVGSINLTADSNSLPADGRSSTAIRAEILDSAGNPVPEGTAVTFNTDLGQFSTNGAMSVTRQTIDDSGMVVVTLISSTQQGVATITASSGSLSQSVSVTFEGGGTIDEAEMLIDVSRRVIESTGSSRSEIQVMLRDQNHNPISDAVVRFSTNLGTITASAVTGADGYAYVNGNQGEFPVLVSARQNGIATIRAWYGPQDDPYASAQTDVRFTGTTLAVSADPDSLSIDEYTVVTASLRGPSGNPLVDQELLLETDLGVFTPISGGIVENDTRFFATTDSSGNVSVRLSSSSGGTATITAWHVPTIGGAGETVGTKEVVFNGQKLTITPSGDWLVADGTSSMNILLELEDEAGDPIANQVISLSTTLGSVNTSVTTNALGQATATLSAGTVVGNAVLNAVADLPDSTITAQAEVPFISGPVDRIELVSEPSIIKVNTGTSEIRALVRDPQGNPVEGVYVSFTIVSAPGGGETITPSIAQTPGLSSGTPGQASAVFSAGSLPSESIGDVLIEASAGSITASTSLTITSGPGNISLGACTTRDCIVDNGDGSYSIPVAAVVSDINGIAVPAGVEVAFSVNNAELGTIVSPGVTNAQGRAATLLTYPATYVNGNIIITAATSGIQESVTIQLPGFDTLTIADIFLSAPASVLGDGTTTAGLRAQAVDINGDRVLASVFFDSNEEMDFTGQPAGTFVNYYYWGSGDTEVDFVATPAPDENDDSSDGFVSQDYDAYVKAYSGNIESDVRQIHVKGITLTIAPQSTSLLANGVSTTKVRAILRETSTGLPIAGKQLNFGVTNGLVSGATATDNSGTAEATFTSVESDVDLTASVRCYYGSDIMASTEIDLVPSADVVNILASADKYTLYNNPEQTAIITAQVLDASGNPVDDGQRVTFEVISGPGQVEGSATTEDGTAAAVFTATPETGTSTVRVASGGQATTIEFEIIEMPVEVSSLAIISGASSLAANGSSMTAIRATVTDTNGNPIPEISVTFETTIGTFVGDNPAVTNTNGVAEVMLQSATAPGIAIVTATAHGFSDQLSVSFVSGAARVLSLTAAPQTLNPGGDSTISATVTDASGNTIPNETVTFQFINNNTGAVLSAPSAVTNINGQAFVSYTAGASNGMDFLQAVTTSDTTVYGTVNITVDSSATVIQGVTLTSGAPELVADGSSEALIRATVTDVNGKSAVGISVLFNSTLGTLVGTNPVTTNASGIAEITLRSGTDTGTARVTATASGFVADVEVLFVAGAPDALSLNASPATVTPGNDSVITATLTDSLGNPLADQSIAFNFTANNSGASLSGTTATTNINGEATITYTAGSNGAVTDTIRAVCVSNTGVAGSVNIDVDASAVSVMIGSLSITASSMEIVADGTSNTAIRARLIDIDGNPVSGRTVAFTTSYGTLSSASAATGPTGIAEVVLTSDTRTGVAVVMASIAADAFSDQVEVQFVPGPPVNANSSITVQPSSIPADGTSTAEVTVTLADANGNPVLNGTQVELYASRGTITTGNPAPTASGRATFTIQAPLTTGTADLSLWDYPDIASAQLGFGSITSGDPASVRIESVSHTEIAVTGVGQNDNTAISVRIADETGSTVINPDLSLLVELLAKPDGGEFLSGEDPDGNLVSHIDEIEIGAANGEATFNLRSGTLPGVVEIRIEVLESGASLTPPIVTVSPQISIASGPPHAMALSAPTLNAVVDLNTGGDAGIPQTPGFYSRRAGLLVTDRWGNPVPDGTTINLGVIDSVIADSGTGSIADGGSVLTDASANFANASITRSGLVREIEEGDRVVLFDVPASDKSRFVTTPIGTTTLPVTRPYENTLTNIEYAVGASLLGASIYGTDGSTATKGTVRTQNGLAQLRLVYPANKNRILVGCYPSGVDTRHLPQNSARVITVFTSSDDRVSMVDEGTLCFSAIAGFTLSAVPDELAGKIGNTFSLTLTLVDGGDEVPLPFIDVEAFVVSEGVITVDVTTGATDENGQFISQVDITGGVSGDSATIKYYAGDAQLDVDVSIP